MYAVCASDTYTYINPYVCYMCFRYMHICTGRITDGIEGDWEGGMLEHRVKERRDGGTEILREVGGGMPHAG